MNNDWFFEKFALIADAPGAVARMRGLVLHMAVQGRLVPQLTTDDPVELLIVAIASDRAAFVKGSGLSRQRELDEVNEDFVPFALPRGWVWTRLGNICRVQAGFAFKSAAFVQSDKGIPIIRIRDITQDHTQVNYLGDYREEFLVNTGDFLVGMDGNFTVAKWRGRRALLNQRVSRLQWYSKRLEPTFFAIAAQHQLTELQGKKAYTTVDHLSSKQIEEAVVPLPPLAEQTRIVAKVDELMGICDALEAQQRERESRKSVLVRASLSRFAESPTPENLGYLFNKSYDIPPSELRKSILTLAVQGLLVAHDSESAAWETRKLKDLTTKIGSGSTPSGGKESYQASGVPLIRSMNVHFGGFVRQGLAFLNDEQAEKLKNVAVKADDVLLNITGASIGRVATAPRNMEGARVNQHVCIVRPTSAITPQFLELFLASPVVQNLIDAVQVGATREALTKTMIEQFEIPVPSVGEQRRIVAKVDQLMALVNELERQQEASRENASKLLDAIFQEMTSGGRDIAATMES